MRKSAVYFARLSECLIAFRPNWGHRPRRQRTAAVYLKAAGIPLRSPGGWGRHGPKPAIEVITDPVPADEPAESSAGGVPAKPAIETITDSGGGLEGIKAGGEEPPPGSSPSASACEPYREAIELGLSRGRNAMAIWQDLVDVSGFAA
jgi:hypothetical protein